MKYAVRTDIGKRETNEDAYLIPREGVTLPLFAVSDGMGGCLAGEVASRMVVDGLWDEFSSGNTTVTERALKSAIRNINISVYRLAKADTSKKGMGATLVCAYIGPEKVLAANVGDSRLYRITDNTILPVTKDQSFVQSLVDSGAITSEEAKTHPRRNCILQAMGAELSIRPDFYRFDRKTGDRLILCSDGLCGVLDESEILGISNANSDVQTCADALVVRALEMQGTDNVTVIVIDLNEEANA